MNISPEHVRIDEAMLWVDLSDGRTIGAPLVWFPRLAHASADDLNDFDLSPFGIHWDALDEDISIEGLLAGRGDVTHRPSQVA